ncbi:MAG: glycosyltransferase family 2 protein [Propionibacteriaceae bacterium]|jgi:glycosyltransferase involved in cell wall biosynthesis|nr:glycosyltransferase family 2 protein [Propionibacteriaceae bacterium]
MDIRYSVVVPVYRNQETLPLLLERLEVLGTRLDGPLEAVFVIDGSPDQSAELLAEALPCSPLASQLVEHSRNFGSFPAIRAGIAVARGEYIGVMAADLQEPPELMEEFFAVLRQGADVAVGRRTARADPLTSTLGARLFWGVYRRAVNRDIPPGGVDVFACTRTVGRQLTELSESHTSLVGLLYWIGFTRVEVPYERSERVIGKSTWTFNKKFQYLRDSVFAFTALPIRSLMILGVVGAIVTLVVGLVVFICRVTGVITEVGYTPLMLTILLSTCLILIGLGVVGSYVWRTYENTKGRPPSVVKAVRRFGPHD